MHRDVVPARRLVAAALTILAVLVAGGCATPGVSRPAAGTALDAASRPRRVCLLTGEIGPPTQGVISLEAVPVDNYETRVTGSVQYWNGRQCPPGQLNPADAALSCRDIGGWLSRSALNLGGRSITATLGLDMIRRQVEETVQFHDQADGGIAALTAAAARCRIAPIGPLEGYAMYWQSTADGAQWLAGQGRITLVVTFSPGYTADERVKLLQSALDNADKAAESRARP